MADSNEVSIVDFHDSQNLITYRCSYKTIEKKKLQKLHLLKSIVEKAVQNHRTFTVLGSFTCIKDTLKVRGWIEKYETWKSDIEQKLKIQESNSRLACLEKEELYDEYMLSRLLKDNTVDLIWTMRNESIKWKKIEKQTAVSRFPRADFTTKVGLCNHLQQVYWYNENAVSFVSFPRCYNISNEEEYSFFIDDFRLTACVSLVKFVNEAFTKGQGAFSEQGTIPLSAYEFAVCRSLEYISSCEHEDIDKIDKQIWDHQWDQFLTSYYLLVYEEAHFSPVTEDKKVEILAQSNSILEKISPFKPDLNHEGTQNLWILKPAAKSRGRGILIIPKLEDIKTKVGSLNSKDNRYVIQKYIERPLLIYGTKFDIRQWFLVTNAYPLAIWMYKESYLRFCSQTFSLRNTHESIHLSNNAIQCKYTNGKRDRNLPDENMWDCYTFQAYLRSKGKSDMWENVIYPGMKQNIVGTLLAAQDTIDTRKNCFELFGADFMLTEDFKPWLIEINSGPSMSASTSVTARMCNQVLEDVIKVVVDKKEDKNANTGMFELVYKQNIPFTQPYMGQNLILNGTRIDLPVKNKNKMKKKSNPNRRIDDTRLYSKRIKNIGDSLGFKYSLSATNDEQITVLDTCLAETGRTINLKHKNKTANYNEKVEKNNIDNDNYNEDTDNGALDKLNKNCLLEIYWSKTDPLKYPLTICEDKCSSTNNIVKENNEMSIIKVKDELNYFKLLTEWEKTLNKTNQTCNILSNLGNAKLFTRDNSIRYSKQETLSDIIGQLPLVTDSVYKNIKPALRISTNSISHCSSFPQISVRNDNSFTNNHGTWIRNCSYTP